MSAIQLPISVCWHCRSISQFDDEQEKQVKVAGFEYAERQKNLRGWEKKKKEMMQKQMSNKKGKITNKIS